MGSDKIISFYSNTGSDQLSKLNHSRDTSISNLASTMDIHYWVGMPVCSSLPRQAIRVTGQYILKGKAR